MRHLLALPGLPRAAVASWPCRVGPGAPRRSPSGTTSRLPWNLHNFPKGYSKGMRPSLPRSRHCAKEESSLQTPSRAPSSRTCPSKPFLGLPGERCPRNLLLQVDGNGEGTRQLAAGMGCAGQGGSRPGAGPLTLPVLPAIPDSVLIPVGLGLSPGPDHSSGPSVNLGAIVGPGPCPSPSPGAGLEAGPIPSPAAGPCPRVGASPRISPLPVPVLFPVPWWC